MNTVSRRSFIKHTSGATIALWLGLSAKGNPLSTTDADLAKNFSPYILVDSKGNITLFDSKPEMGQGTFQSIPALIAEEFEVSLEHVNIKLTHGEKEFGNRQHAGGSSSVRGSYNDLRKVGASAKAVFIMAANKKWNVSPDTCYAEDGFSEVPPTDKATYCFPFTS